MMLTFIYSLLLVASGSAFLAAPPGRGGFLHDQQHYRPATTSSDRRLGRRPLTFLASGIGIATNYTWKEEAFEIEVSAQVPRDTRAKDIGFTATSRSIDLRILRQNEKDVILLDGSRRLRGRVNVDGTYWVITDPDPNQKNNDCREVTVTIEKIIRTPRDDFEVVDYDWKGVYTNDTAEVLERTYDKPEKLDVREYAASLGVDIDNIDMSKVDKTMFSSGLNVSQSSLDALNKAGLIKEITRQADGKEYELDDQGEPVPFSQLGESIGDDELKRATAGSNSKSGRERPKIPFLDTNSPWHTANRGPVQLDPITNKTYVQQTRNFTRAAFAQDSAEKRKVETGKGKDAADPIDLLTVKRLKEILKSQGQKVTGNKQELQDRLRRRVNSLLQGITNPEE